MKRIVLALLFALLVLPFIFASGKSAQTSDTTTTTVTSGKYKEAPMLAERVANKELESVEERLPKNPVVIKTGLFADAEHLEVEVGKYGGTRRDVFATYMAWGEFLFLFSNMGYEIKGGNIIEKWDISDDYREYTFTLREGLKWSDGVPVTTEDARFCWEVINDERIYASLSPVLRQGGIGTGAIPEFTVIDELTWRYTYPETDYLLIRRISNLMLSPWHMNLFLKPAHYLKQFHIDYADASEIEPILKEKELDQWFELFRLKDPRYWDNLPVDHAEIIGAPLLGPWVPIEVREEYSLAERNPYFHWVDTDGQQLPYFDYVWSALPWAAWSERKQMMMWSKELDYYWGDDSAMPIMLENQENGDYTGHFYSNAAGAYFYINLTYDDPQWREVVQEKKFRQAIDYAIDKNEINEEVYFGTGTLPQDHTPTESTREHSVAKANALLDEIGMDKRDSDGWRLGPDGEPFEFAIDAYNQPVYIKDSELIVEHLREVGLNASYKVFDNTAMGQRVPNNEAKAYVSWGTGNMWEEYIGTDYLPSNNWSPLWSNWYSGLTPAEEPPEWIKELYDIEERISSNPIGSAAAKKAFEDLYAYYQEWTLRIALEYGEGVPNYFSNRMGNVANWSYFHGQWDLYKIQYFK